MNNTTIKNDKYPAGNLGIEVIYPNIGLDEIVKKIEYSC